MNPFSAPSRRQLSSGSRSFVARVKPPKVFEVFVYCPEADEAIDFRVCLRCSHYKALRLQDAGRCELKCDD
jgi:hypothetical protein